MFKRLLCIFLLFVLSAFPLSVFAAGEAGFYLTDVSTDKNRLFETTLCVSGEVAAFTATLTYDENDVAFRGAKAIDSEAELSVNSNETGKVKIAYLCESGVAGEILTLTFKSSEQSAYIDLNAEQVIDSNAKDLSVTSLKGAEVTVNATLSQSKGNSNNQSEKSQTDTVINEVESSANSSTSYIEIPPKNGVDITFIVCIAGVGILLFAVAAIAFVLGRKTSAANKKHNRKT